MRTNRKRDVSYEVVEKPGGPFKDLTNKVFDRLSVLRLLGRNRRAKCYVWEVKCVCGEVFPVLSVNLLSGNTRSCGCRQREMISNYSKGRTPSTQLPKGQAALNHKYSMYKNSKPSLKYGFELSKEQFKALILQNCYYCGEPPATPITNSSRNLNGSFLANGVDRVDSSKGYSLDNCVACCTRCNLGKREHSVASFLDWVFKVANFNKGSKIK